MKHALRALVVTSDASLVSDFTQISKEIGVEAQAITGNTGTLDEIRAGKYEAVVLDCDTVPDAPAILASVRQSRSNQNAVAFAIATDKAKRHSMLESGANLVLERPLESKQIRRALYAAYDLMVRERRRYFRLAVELPVLVIQASSGVDFRCKSTNISSNGIALKAPSAFIPGENVQVIVFLRDAQVIIRTIGTVVWDDRHGKTGISFKCTNAEHQGDLDSWLDGQLLLHAGPNRSEQGLLT